MSARSFSLLKWIPGLLLGCIFMAGCENDVNEVRDLSRKRISIEEGKNIDSYLSMNGKVRAHLTAPLLYRYQGDSAKRSEFPKTLHVDFYDDSMKVESQISAKYGEYKENENKVLLRDRVVAFNTKGDTLFTEELWWDKNTEKFYTSKKVIISKGFRSSLFIGLDGMTCDQNLNNLVMYSVKYTGSYTTIPDSSISDKPAPVPPVIKPAGPK